MVEMDFDYAVYWGAENFRVGYSKTGNTVGDFTWSENIERADNWFDEDGFEHFYARFPVGTKYIAINYYSEESWMLLIDNIVIDEAPVPVYSIFFKNEGIYVDTVEQVACADPLELISGTVPACSVWGWTFYGWSITSVAETSTPPLILSPGSYFTPIQDTTMYAVYQRSGVYTSTPFCVVLAETSNNLLGEVISLTENGTDYDIEVAFLVGCVVYGDPAYTVTPAGAATVTKTGNVFTVTDLTALVTVTINLIQSVINNVVTFNNEGTVIDVIEQPDCVTPVTLPSATSHCPDQIFYGWSETAVPETTTPPTPIYFVPGTYFPLEDTTLHAVYRNTAGGTVEMAPLTSAEILNIPNHADYEVCTVPSAFGDWTGKIVATNEYLQINTGATGNAAGSYIQSPVYSGIVSAVKVYYKTPTTSPTTRPLHIVDMGDNIVTSFSIPASVTEVSHTFTGLDGENMSQFKITSGGNAVRITGVEVTYTAATIYTSMPECIPAIRIVTPVDGTEICGKSVDVLYALDYFTPGTDGRIEYFINGIQQGYSIASPIVITNGLIDGPNNIELLLVDDTDAPLGHPEAIATVDIISKQPTDSIIRINICEGEDYISPDAPSFTFMAPAIGTYTTSIVLEIPNSVGCDSTLYLILNVHKVYDDTIQAKICIGSDYTQNGFNILNPPIGTHYHTNGPVPSIHTCDSMLTVKLIVDIKIDDTIRAAICLGETYSLYDFDETPTSLGYYYKTKYGLLTTLGCDSIVTLELFVKNPTDTTIRIEICEGGDYISPDHPSFTFMSPAAGRYTASWTTINEVDCDSTLNLILVVHPRYEVDTIYKTICEGETYLFKGELWDATGIYQDTLFTAHHNCDSIITLNLTVIPIPSYGPITQMFAGCVGYHTGGITLPDLSLDGVSYKWIYPSGVINTTRTLNVDPVTVADTGIYQLTVSVAGCHFPDSVHIIAYNLPDANFIYTNPLSDLENYEFTALDPSCATYDWIIDGNIESGNPAYLAFPALDADGKVVTLTVTSAEGGCTAQLTRTINASVPYVVECNPNIEITLPASVCGISRAALVELIPPTVRSLISGTIVVPGPTTVTITDNAPAMFTHGAHIIKWTVRETATNILVDTCIQLVLVNYPACGETDFMYVLESMMTPDYTTVPRTLFAIDLEGNQYGTARLGCDCWLSQNLKSTLYSDGTHITGTYKYYDARMYPDSNANAEIFGLLYNWEAAVRPSVATDQGACPAGWLLPTEAQFSALGNYNAKDLRSIEYWLEPGTNLTKFNALPAGMYNEMSNSYFYLMGDAYFWSRTNTSTVLAKACHLGYGCPTAQIIEISTGSGLSVRCVKE